ncbi:hypothetical protein GWI33_005265 [Rhynchophorus ferrugineus]|uniref:Uncharacterized protein n=1 Tax=Rhynchophorus ferrugineus TaxID=354439 RepID=A0A834ILV7_RHYFE|nr:hypothetical protein GWI33_005265 [Rhynchophorus ferrugineus]
MAALEITSHRLGFGFCERSDRNLHCFVATAKGLLMKRHDPHLRFGRNTLSTRYCSFFVYDLRNKMLSTSATENVSRKPYEHGQCVISVTGRYLSTEINQQLG